MSVSLSVSDVGDDSHWRCQCLCQVSSMTFGLMCQCVCVSVSHDMWPDASVSGVGHDLRPDAAVSVSGVSVCVRCQP